jgi:hypothetical protein
MSIKPKYVAMLAIIAQNPNRHKKHLNKLKGVAKKIAQAMITPDKVKHTKEYFAAKDIIQWAKNNRI